VDAYDIGDLPADKIVILSTGSQGEPLSALARMANGDHRTVKIQSGDTVIISASPVPGNEKAVSRVINRLCKAGAEVFDRSVADVHVSGHGAAEELKLMLSMTKPRNFMPVHGETRHLVAHSRIAHAVGVPEDKVFVLDNGDCLEIDEHGVARIAEHVEEAGVVYVDGLHVGDIGDVILRDRQQLSSDGFATIVVAIDQRTRKVVGEPELVIRGLPITEVDDITNQARARIVKALNRMQSEGATDHGIIQRAMRDALSQFVWETLRRRPLIIPIIMEV
jgi:ribonuclease J